MTAVEWLTTQFPMGLKTTISDKIQQAKEMEKEQIVTAHYQGYRNDIGNTEVSEQYYKETFKTK